MITPEQIREKASRLYGKAIAAWLADESFFPRRVPVDLKVPTDLAQAVAAVQRLRQHSKEQRRDGYRIEWESRRSRSHGQNDFPKAIVLDSMNDLCGLIGASPTWTLLQTQVATLRLRLPSLDRWLREPGNWRKLLEVDDALDGLVSLTRYFVAHPRPGVFARQIPVASSKLLENHKSLLGDWLDRLLPAEAIDPRYDATQFEARYGLRYARPHFLVRSLDRAMGQRIGLPFDECSLPAETLSRLEIGDADVYIVENKISVLTMPQRPNSLVLGGLGNGVTQLVEIAWLHDRSVYYWGDFDAAGFEILSRLRGLLPDVRSWRMNTETLTRYRALATHITKIDPRTGLHLTDDERAGYEFVCQNGLRIEQEHLPD